MIEEPEECKQVWIPDPTHEKRGYWTEKCKNIIETSSNTDMDGETYECSKCGYRYRLYYEDML